MFTLKAVFETGAFLVMGLKGKKTCRSLTVRTFQWIHRIKEGWIVEDNSRLIFRSYLSP